MLLPKFGRNRTSQWRPRDDLDMQRWPVVRQTHCKSFVGWAVASDGDPEKGVKYGLWQARNRGRSKAFFVPAYGVSPWEVAVQLGHSVGKDYAVTERYAFYNPDHLCGAVQAFDSSCGRQAFGPVGRRDCSIAAVAQG